MKIKSLHTTNLMEMFPNENCNNALSVKTFTFDKDKIVFRKGSHNLYQHYILIVIEKQDTTIQKCVEFKTEKKQSKFFNSVDSVFAFDILFYYNE